MVHSTFSSCTFYFQDAQYNFMVSSLLYSCTICKHSEKLVNSTKRHVVHTTIQELCLEQRYQVYPLTTASNLKFFTRKLVSLLCTFKSGAESRNPSNGLGVTHECSEVPGGLTNYSLVSQTAKSHRILCAVLKALPDMSRMLRVKKTLQTVL